MTTSTPGRLRLFQRRRISRRLRPLWRRWATRLQRYATVEVIAGVLIVSTWAALVGVGIGSPVIVVIIVGLSIWLHLAAVETGGHTTMWLATGMVLAFIVIAGQTVFGGFKPVSYALAAQTALIHNELIRLSHARRRWADIDEQIYINTAIGVGLVALASVVGVGLAEPLSRSTDRSWLWMVAAATVLAVVVAAILLLPARRSSAPDRQRWRPGDRIPPQPQDGSVPESPSSLYEAAAIAEVE